MKMRQILKSLMESQGDNAYTLQEKSGVPQPTTQRFLSGKQDAPSSKTVQKWAVAYGLNESQLRGDLPIEGEITINSADINTKQFSNKTINEESFELLQYEDVAGAMGSGILLKDQPGKIKSFIVTKEWAQKNIPNNTGLQNIAIVTGFGDSMKGLFNSGDPLIVDTGVKELDYDAVYFFRVGTEGFIKRLQRIPGEGVRVISTNKEYDRWTITKDMDFQIFARVIKAWKSEDL